MSKRFETMLRHKLSQYRLPGYEVILKASLECASEITISKQARQRLVDKLHDQLNQLHLPFD